jgi:hypothetical protein
MLTIKIERLSNNDVSDDIIQALQMQIDYLYAENYKEWSDIIARRSSDSIVLIEPKTDAKDIAFRCLMVEIGVGKWKHIYFHDCNVYVMNDNGKTVAEYSAY